MNKLYLLIIGVIVFAGVIIFFLPASIDKLPDVERVPFMKGGNQAEIKIEEYSDFQCPACKMAEPEIKKILEEYKDKISFTYRHFPLSQHTYALKAAKAAEAAGRQNKFWEMHDLLFENQDSLSDSLFEKLAEDLKLDLKMFKIDFQSKETAALVEADKKTALSLGVNSTPTFFVNGKKYEGFMTAKQWKLLLENEYQVK